MKFLSILLLASLMAGATQGADWLQFRGPAGSGVADATETAALKTFSDASLKWSADLPGRGLSSPIVVGDRVFVTCASGADQDQLHVFCFNAADGRVRWERKFWATGRTMTHGKTNVAASTPCSDGKHVFALFSSNDLICLDLDGNLKWLRGLTYDYPNASNSLGMASSPIVAGGVLVVQSENDSESFAAGIDVVSGENRWMKTRPKMANWTSPVVLSGAQEVVALQSSKGLLGIAPETGSELWNFEGGASTIESATIKDGIIYVPSGGITALKPNAQGGAPEQLWKNAQIAPKTGSPLVLNGKIFSVTGAGVLTASDITDGQRGWRIRIEGPFSASPIAAGNVIYLFNEQGLGQTVDVSGEEGVVTGKIDLKETILSTPSLSNGAIYVRSDGHLWKLAP